MNPLHLDGYGVEIQAGNTRTHVELKITGGRTSEGLPERYTFKPRRCPYDSIIVEGKTGHVSLQALRWLSAHEIPVYLLAYDGNVISQVLPPVPIMARLRIAQLQAYMDTERRRSVAYALVKAKVTRALQLLEWLGEHYKIGRQQAKAKREAARLDRARSIGELRSVEAHVALPYWIAYQEAIPKGLDFQGRRSDSRNSNACDPVNATLNYGYGFLKVLCRTAINTIGLEPAVGFMHETTALQTAESLVYDLQEPFRFLVDLTVVEAFQDNILTLQDFAWNKDDYLFRIEWEGRQRYLDLLRDTFNDGVVYKGRTLKWDTVIEEKAAELGRYLTEGKGALDFCEPSPIFS
jgi:CRISPR-associated protein Cas1